MSIRYPATFGLVLSLALVFTAEWWSGAFGSDAGLYALGALPDSGDLQDQYWRFVSFAFLHAGYAHFLANAAGIGWIGTIVERRAGWGWMLGLFLVGSVCSGVGIHLKHLWAPGVGVSVGASGGLFALLGTTLLLFRQKPPQNRRIIMWFSLVLGSGIVISFLPGVSLVGHAVGLLVGLTGGALVNWQLSRALVAGQADNSPSNA